MREQIEAASSPPPETELLLHDQAYRPMTVSDEEIRERLALGEDSGWEFKQIESKGDMPTSPRREDLADELAAFANAGASILLCGVTDDGQIQGMSRNQMVALDRMLVEVPKGVAMHDHSGRSFIRVGATKQRLGNDERLRLSLKRAQSRYLWFDRQVVPQTGFESLDERLWEPLISVTGAANPPRALMNIHLLAQDEAGIDRATVAGVLLCTQAPQQWLPHATILATHYRGRDRASGQLYAQEITGPIPAQIAEAVKFVARNMRVAARKMPEREDAPQYSLAAVFEAVVNALAHRDYSMSARHIRLSMFSDRLEIDSPGGVAG